MCSIISSNFALIVCIAATSLSVASCGLYCCCRHSCIKQSGEQDSYSGSIVGRPRLHSSS